jgi:hypothetical protein
LDLRSALIWEFCIGFVISVVVTLFYGIIAPWYKHSAGRYIFGLLSSISLVMSNSIIRLAFPNLPAKELTSFILLGLFVLSMAAVGWGIYNAQIKNYRRRRFIKSEKERHREL